MPRITSSAALHSSRFHQGHLIHASLQSDCELQSSNAKGGFYVNASVESALELTIYKYRNLTIQPSISSTVEVFGRDGVLKWAADNDV